MTAVEIDERTRVRKTRELTETAIAYALSQDWRLAVEVNRALLRLAPSNIEALNRLAKALLEMEELHEAREAVESALRIDPSNTIARRNRDRLERVEGTRKLAASGTRRANGAVPSGPAPAGIRSARKAGATGTAPTPNTLHVSPETLNRNVHSGHLLMNDAGKRTIATLIDVPDPDAVGRLSSGDLLTLTREGSRLPLHSCRGDVVGRVHPQLAQRILSLMDAGNRYEAAFLRDHAIDGVQVIIGEVYQHPSQRGRPSFPPSGGSEFRGYVRNAHDLVDRGLGGPPARDTSDDEDDPPEGEGLVRAHARSDLARAMAPFSEELG